jgi:hypothetical protein
MRANSMTPRDNVVGTPRLGLTGGLSQAAVAALTPRFFVAKEPPVMSCLHAPRYSWRICTAANGANHLDAEDLYYPESCLDVRHRMAMRV